MYLKTGHQLHSYQWQELPITNTVIYCVEEMDTSEEAPEMIDGYLKFEWSPGNPITDDDKSEHEHSEGVQEEIYLEY